MKTTDIVNRCNLYIMNKVRNILVLLALFAFTAQGAWAQSGNWSEYAATQYAQGDGTSKDPWVITTAEELAYFAKQLTIRDNTYSGKYFVLGADIDLAEHYWTPAGRLEYSDGKRAFSGIFDGNGHTIKNMSVVWGNTTGNTQNYGFFSVLNTSAYVKNLVFDNASLVCNQTSDFSKDALVGVLAGNAMNNTKVYNVIVRNSKINVQNAIGHGDKWILAGGLLGKVETNTGFKNYSIKNIYVDTDIDVSKIKVKTALRVFVGGLLAQWNDPATAGPDNIFVAGSIKVPSDSKCTNVGTVIGKNFEKINNLGTLKWYYVNKPVNEKGGDKSLAASQMQGTQTTFAETVESFAALTNTFASSQKLSGWSYNSGSVSLVSIDGAHVDHDKSEHRYTLDFEYGTPSDYAYRWTVGGTEYSSTTDANGSYADLPTTNTEQSGTVKVIKNGTIIYEVEFTIPAEKFGVAGHVISAGFSGDGSAANPYIISSVADLSKLSYDVTNKINDYSNKNFELRADIDLNDGIWLPIGGMFNENVFKGKFDGKGHTISNMHLSWTPNNSGHVTSGLFARVNGVDDNTFASISNLIIDNATISKSSSASVTAKQVNIGVLVADLRERTEISNIIVRNSKITDGSRSYTVNGEGVRIGGIIGNQENANAKYRILNLSSDVDITMFNKATVSVSSWVGGVIGRFQQISSTDTRYLYPTNLYYQGTMNCKLSGSGYQFYGKVVGNKDWSGNTYNSSSWYFTGAAATGNCVVDYGTQKTLDAFATDYRDQNNEFIQEKQYGKLLYWNYKQATGYEFVPFSGTLTSVHESTHLTNAHVYTVNTTGDYIYEWYVDGAIQSSTGKVATLSTKYTEQSGRVVVKKGGEQITEMKFVIPAEVYGVSDHICATSFKKGSGTQADPYIISTAAELAYLSKRVYDNKSENAYFALDADIDLDNAIWTPIGRLNGIDNYVFKGKLDGRGHVVRNMHLFWDDATNAELNYGLFSTLSGADISNIIIDNAKLLRTSGNALTQARLVGVLAGTVRQNTVIRNVIVRGSEITTVAFNPNWQWLIAGGLVARIYDDGSHKIYNVSVQTDIDFSKVQYSGNSNDSRYYVGGIAGEWKKSTNHTLTNAYYMGTITNPAGATGVGNAIFGTGAYTYEPSACTNLYRINDAPGRNTEAEQKSLSFGNEFRDINNEYLVANNLTTLKSWLYDPAMPGFSFLDFSVLGVTNAHKSDHSVAEHTFTLTLGNGTNASDYKYKWTVGSFSSAGVSSANTNKADIPTKREEQTGTVQILDKATDAVIYELGFTVPAEVYGVQDHLYANGYASGSGTEKSPYVISNDIQLARLALDVTKGVGIDKYYKINADIDLSKASWTPIGSLVYADATTFKGSLDGNGHTISNMAFDWYTATGSECRFGLFSSIAGTESRYADVRNLVIDNAKIKCGNASNLVKARIVAVFAGVIHQYSSVQNIIIRNSEIDGAATTFNQNSNWVLLGGLAGKINDGNNNYKLNNIAVDVTINAENLNINNAGAVCVGGLVAQWQTNAKTCLNNAFAHGMVYVPETCTNVGSVFGSNQANLIKETVYYVNEIGTNQGNQKTLASFALPFCEANNDFIDANKLKTLLPWNFNASDDVFFFGSFGTELTVDYKSMVVVTATTPGKDGSEKYNWYISSDKKSWVKSEISSTNTLNLPYEGNIRYVYAEVADASSRSNASEISTIIKADAYLTKTDGTYKANITNTLWDADNQYLTASYQWMMDGTVVRNTTGDSYTPSAADANKKVSCHVTLSSGEYSILDKILYMGKVIFIKPEDNLLGDTRNNGLTPETPVRTWQKAYSLLDEDATWNENKIVLIGRSSKEATCISGLSGTTIYHGFGITTNLQGDNPTEQYKEWKAKVDASHLAKNVTITGKYNGKDYGGIIETYGDGGKKHLGIFGDTRFENITFNHDASAGSYDIIFCQYNSIEMGEGVQMTGFINNAPGYGTIDGARTASFQIFGGFNNDARFRTGDKAVVDMTAMQNAMPHGKEGFSITLKSGHYSCICVGGRQSTGDKKLNSIMGTPNMPIKCTVTVDIDRSYNDAHNQPKADYDCGIVMAGNHEGAMYADVDIILKSGYVARVVNGTLGNVRDYEFNYNNKNYKVPNNSFMGRANILIDPRDGTGNIDNNRVIVTELYGGSTGRGFAANTTVDNPFYGYSTVTINGGTFTILPKTNTEKSKIFSGIYGAGAGGINGIGDDSHPTADTRIPYWSGDGKVVLYGDYATAKKKLVSFNCYNSKDGSFTSVDPTLTNTKVVINGGIFGSEFQKIDGVYACGSGYMSKGLWTDGSAIPSSTGGNVYGKTGETVSTMEINGGTFYCEHGIFAGGRGTDYYYSVSQYGGTASNYNELGKTYGNVELKINGGTFNCDIFGGGYGVADAKLLNANTYATLSNMARVYGKSILTIGGDAVVNGSVYGGGDMAVVDNGTADATNLTIQGHAVVNGSVYASGNGRRYKKNPTDDETKAYTYTRKSDEVGRIIGNAKLTISGTPKIYGDVYGGGAYGSTTGSTTIAANGGRLNGNIYGGGQGDLATMTKSTVTGDATVNVAGMKAALGDAETTSFADGKHNIYGGGYLVAGVDGKATVNMTKGFAGSDIIATGLWQSAYKNNAHRNFCVYGGGYGANTTVGNTVVNISIDVDEENVVLGSIGGSYAGVVEKNTSTTIQGTPVLRSVYGGGYGTIDGATAGIVRGNATLSIKGGKIDCDVFGGGAGIGSNTTTYEDVARVYGKTSLTVTGTAAVYGNVYGGGDVANVGSGTVTYSSKPTSTSISNGALGAYTHSGHATFVNVTGGNIFGKVFGGGNGRLKADVYDYTKVGRVTGNTLVHVATSKDGDDKTVEPYIWNRIYGAGSYGTVDGNAMVHIEGGHLGNNIFGGGFGDASTDTPETAEGARKGTYANVLGNTEVKVDGGAWLWYAKADEKGNITTWDKASTKLSKTFAELRKMPEAERRVLVQDYIDTEFFTRKENGHGFIVNHNIYGGGNAACYVGSDGVTGTGTSKVTVNHSPLTDVTVDGKTYNLLDPNTAAGFCWFTSVDNNTQPQFSVFGAGYGMNTKVMNTEVYAQPGAKLDATGNMQGYKYVNQMADLFKYVAFEKEIYDNYQAVDDDTRRRLYGMGDNTSDPRTYLRYRASELAWSMGAPSFTFMNIHGGGFSGYVTGNTKVVTDCQLACRNVFGGGVGSKPSGTALGNETYGQVGGNTDVKIYGGFIAMNVFGGGAGIESYKVNGNYVDFTDMARVNGKTNVDVYGESYKITYLDNRDIERTLIFGSVYGGGDVANVGTEAVSAAKLEGKSSSESYTTKVNVRGASIMSPVFAGGNGRANATCADYTKLGAVYGNAALFVNKADKAYPYTSSKAPSTDVIPYLWSRAYGGGNKGLIYGNTLVKVDKGYFSDDIFAGGLGVAAADAAQSTSADITGNTNLVVNGGEAKLTSLWKSDERSWEPATKLSTNSHLYSPQYDPQMRKFKVNHNMYGGGNLACVVSGDSYIKMTKGMLNAQETVSATSNPNGSFFATDEWKEVYEKTGTPYFCVFGGGYGNQTIIAGNTNLNINITDDGGIAGIGERKAGEEYLHFVPGQSVMDVIGGGFEGRVNGETNVNIAGGTFARRVFGGGHYNSVKKSNVTISSIDCEDIFGGGMMGDVELAAKVNIGADNAPANENIHIHGNVYGGNDVSGYVNLKDKADGNDIEFQDNGGEGVFVTIRGGHIYGNVYGAGNGDYLYALDKKGNTTPTVNEYYETDQKTYNLVFTVPMRKTIASGSTATDAQKIVNINSWRPLTNKVTLDIEGKSATSKPVIDGNVFGGGNTATVVNTDKNSHVTINVGSNIKLGGLFLGCDGEQLFTQTEAKDYMRALLYTDGINLNNKIDWTLAANKNIKKIYVPADNASRAKAYPHCLDLYFQPVAMSIRPTINWKGSLTNTTIGSFVCGGNRGNMDVTPDADGNAVKVEFPEGLTITDKIVGGCFNANYDKRNNFITVDHVGGYLLGETRTKSPMIDLLVKCKFSPSTVVVDGKKCYAGGNVYGGCYQSGVVVGDVKIDYRSNTLNGLDESLLAASNEIDSIAACSVYGAGYGKSSYVYGDINVLYAKDVPSSVSGKTYTGTTVNNIFGGGEKGNVIGNTDIRILNGKVLGSVTGGSFSGHLWGSAQVLVGYPTYYICNKSAKYGILRADDASANLNMVNTDINGTKTNTIKQSVNIMKGDIVSEQVVDAINAYDEKNSTLQTMGAFEKKTTSPSYPNGWNDVNIQIGVAVYGGGYATSDEGNDQSNTTTVLRYTEKYNNITVDYNTSKNGEVSYAKDNDLDATAILSYGGNTTMLIADLTPDSPSYNNYEEKEHITISPQTMKIATGLADNADLFQRYYMDKTGNYHFISMEGKYFKNGSKDDGTWPADISDDDHNFYDADTEGGIFGDGHLSYAQGFRNGELSGYGYAKHTVASGKILNTFQRMDMLRLKDNCVKLLGARDYATNSSDVTPYSISRVGEIQMMSSIDGTGKLADRETMLATAKTRNYLGLSNNIRYVGAVKTDDDFATSLWHSKDGELGTDEYAGKSYRYVKDDYLKYHEFTGNKFADKNEITYQKRNEGTARNLIGIASGYSLKIRNVKETYSKNKVTETPFYGPIVGVAEIRLVNINPDEAGGYVYADNRHLTSSKNGYHNFLEETGNFVFPYIENPDMYVVDDCFPNGWEYYKTAGTTNKDAAHYWYLTGYHYYLNSNISAYTYNSATKAMNFESNSEMAEEDVDILKGLIQNQQLQIVSWDIRSNHNDGFSSDLEERNYDSKAVDNSGYSLKDKYKLYVSISDKKAYSDAAVHYELPMNDTEIAKGTVIPGKITADVSRIAFKLVDQADNTSSKYFKSHMEEPTLATLVLRAPALNADGSPIISKMTSTEFYTFNATTGEYDKVAINTKLSSGTKYYFKNTDTGDYEMFYDGANFKNNVYQKTGDSFGNAMQITSIQPNNSRVYYLDVQRSYTYTIYLNITYIQGPSPEGNITIENCALPGEFIKVNASSVRIDADQSMRPQNFYWRIGKLNAAGTNFEDNTVWDKNNSSTGYEAWEVGTDPTGIFARCEAIGNDVLYIPAYYYMNGYAVQYGFVSREGTDMRFFPIEMKRAEDKAEGKILDCLEVHNYHRMDPHEADVDLHLAEAVERAKTDTKAQPRIYIADAADLKAFSEFVRNTNKGANAQFVLLKDVTLPEDYVMPDEFAGTLHGDGYVVSGGSLFKKNSGKIYNLGMADGKIANTNAGLYSCCFEANGLKVYGIDGNVLAGYTASDFKYGKVAYDLNQYYLKKAGKLTGNTKTYTYVEDYYRNGDYQYAHIADENSGVTYLRKGSGLMGDLTTPRYYIMDQTAHNTEHTADIRWSKDHYEPLLNAKGMNDYLYFGQELQLQPEKEHPIAITSHKVEAALNRVWRTDGYYGSKATGKFHYNAAIYNEDYMATYVLDPKTTAVNFNVNDENASKFHGFGTADGVTRNLLVYTAKGTTAANEAADVVSKALAYTATLPEAGIRGHHITKNGQTWNAEMLHLVDKQTFNAPIAFNVTGKSWYVRNPETETGYVEKVGAGWESICLPFAVDKSTLSTGIQMYNESTGAASQLVKDITFFYGTPADGTTVANNNNTLRHHYWFRELASVAGNQAAFSRPASAITAGGFKAYTPYIVSFPGSRYYEFDMTGQTVTFSNAGGATIAVTDDAIATVTKNGAAYHAAFANEEGTAGKYAIEVGGADDVQGIKFEKNQPIYAFRGYMTGSSSSAKAMASSFNDAIYISTDIRSIESLNEDENSADIEGEYLRVYDAEGHSIGVESSYETKLSVYTAAGQLVRILDVRPGNSKYSGFAPGIYIINEKKLYIR